MQKLIDDINEKLLRTDGKLNSAVLRQDWFKASDLNNEILNRTSFLPSDASYSERFYIIRNNLTEIPKCMICKQKPRKFSPPINDYTISCGHILCVTNIENVKLQASKNLKQYQENLNASYNKFMDDEHEIMTRTQILDYIKDNGLNFIGNRTNPEQWIVNYSMLKLTDSVFSSSKNFSERLYFLKNDLSEKPICKWCKNSARKYINFDQGYSPTCGDILCSQDQASFSKRENTKREISEYFNKHNIEILNFDYLNSSSKVKLKCTNGHEYERYIHNGRWSSILPEDLCTVCNKTESLEERELFEYIESIVDPSFKIIRNYKYDGMKEIDIFIPNHRIGIEYNVLYWHSFESPETKEQKYKHQIKTIELEKLGIKCIQINSHDWKTKTSIIKGRLRYLLSQDTGVRHYARDCIIKEVSYLDEKEYLNKNHTQGHVNSKLCYGLYNKNNILVSLMSFGKSRFEHREKPWEILRYCGNVVGGAQKLFKHFVNINEPIKVISYADYSWGMAGLYKKLNFEYVALTSPNYFWYKNNKIISRYLSQKQKLCNLLENYDESLSEQANMFNNGFRRYWDCGHSKWIWTRAQSQK